MVGGGLGSHHRQSQTFPRLADELGMCNEGEVIEVVKTILRFKGITDVELTGKSKDEIPLEEWGVKSLGMNSTKIRI